MRVLETSTQRLTLEDRPLVIGVILVAVILLLLALVLATLGESLFLTFGLGLMAAMFGGAFVIFVRRTTVIFDRIAGTVVIRTKSMLGPSETTHALASISRASVETSTNRSASDSGTRGKTYRTVVHVDSEVVPLTQIYTGGDSAERMAKAINDWLGQ